MQFVQNFGQLPIYECSSFLCVQPVFHSSSVVQQLKVYYCHSFIDRVLDISFACRSIDEGVAKVYFFYSFAFLILRTIAVSLYAAWINDESKEPAATLNSVPSATYSDEVMQ